uniref:Uncharacterized protein n=1 Tax=Arundo donax TaxID=35708 RepID=A0A0A9GS96_ARUDO
MHTPYCLASLNTRELDKNIGLEEHMFSSIFYI